MTIERKIFWVPVIAGLLLTLNGIWGAIATGSQAVLFDGLFSVVAVLTGLFTLHVSSLLERPGDARYPFGYASYEPLVNIVKGCTMLGLFLYMALDSALIIWSGGAPVEFGAAVGFTALSASISVGAALAVRSLGRKSRTPLVQGEVTSWTLDAIAMLGVTASLAIAYVLSGNGLESVAAYVDPAVAMALVLFTIYTPYKLTRDSLHQLLGRMPGGEDVELIERAIRHGLADAPIAGLSVVPMKLGRFWQILVYARLDAHVSQFTVAEADRAKLDLAATMNAIDPRTSVEIIFTYLNFVGPMAGECSSNGRVT